MISSSEHNAGSDDILCCMITSSPKYHVEVEQSLVRRVARLNSTKAREVAEGISDLLAVRND